MEKSKKVHRIANVINGIGFSLGLLGFINTAATVINYRNVPGAMQYESSRRVVDFLKDEKKHYTLMNIGDLEVKSELGEEYNVGKKLDHLDSLIVRYEGQMDTIRNSSKYKEHYTRLMGGFYSMLGSVVLIVGAHFYKKQEDDKLRNKEGAT